MIGLIAAMPEEQQALTRRMSDVKQRNIAGIEFYEGRMGKEQAVVALSGVGKVSAAIASTVLCLEYRPDALLSIGVAGGLIDEQQVGDLVLSECAVQADFDTSPIDGKEGIGKFFQADAALLGRASKAADKAGLNWRKGMVATQDLFMSKGPNLDRLMERFPQSACSEMEGGAIAQTAAQFGIPFLIIRTLSDVAVHDDNPVQFSEFSKASSEKAGEFFEIFCSEN